MKICVLPEIGTPFWKSLFIHGRGGHLKVLETLCGWKIVIRKKKKKTLFKLMIIYLRLLLFILNSFFHSLILSIHSWIFWVEKKMGPFSIKYKDNPYVQFFGSFIRVIRN
jgi:hypothetical protein